MSANCYAIHPSDFTLNSGHLTYMVVYVHRHVFVGVSLQVVIGLCKRKETAALKIKAAASYVRENMSALRRLFSFAVVRQISYLLKKVEMLN